VRVCPFCGTENEVFFKFCLGCGADLDDALGSADAEPAPVAEPAPTAEPASAAPVVDDAPSAAEADAAEPAVMPTAPPTTAEPLPSTLVKRKGPGTTDTTQRPSAKREPASRRVGAAAGRLVLILEDGTDGAVYDLAPDQTVIGREDADICFPHDDFLAPRHAQFAFSGNQLVLTPLPSTNGVFMQVSHEVELRNGDVFRIGQELLCFELLAQVIKDPRTGVDDALRLGSPIPEGAWGRLGQLIAPETWGAVYLLGGSDIYLGRERGDITFPGDGFVSGLHAVIMQRDDRYFLKDLGSSNGTYYRLSRAMPLRRGALVLAGQQLFRVEH